MASEYKLVTNCTTEDGAGIAQAKISAFWAEPWWTSAFPADRTETILDSMTLREPYNQLTSRNVRRHQKVVHVPTGEIVGYARWIVPREGDWLDAQTPAASEEDEARFKAQHASAYWNFVPDGDLTSDAHIQGWRETLTPKGPVIVLDYLCCKKEHQKRGVAGLLLKSGFDQADRLKLPVTIYVMGEKARALYLKHGAEQLAEHHSDMRPVRDCTYSTYWLVYMPKETEV